MGGALVPQAGARAAEWRYSSTDARHSAFPMPAAASNADNQTATFYIRDTTGQWRSVRNRPDGGSTTNGVTGMAASSGASFVPTGVERAMWPHCVNDQWGAGKRPYRECSGGGYLFQPCVVLQRAPTFDVFGELDGVYIVSGYDNASENTATFAGDEHVVIANTFRSIPSEFFALRLED